MSPNEFKAAFRNHPSGVAIVTADAGTGPVAMTVSSLSSLSVEPALLTFAGSESSSSTPTLLVAQTIVVHLIGSGQLDLAQLCATSGADRFASTVAWSRLATGEPYYLEPSIWIRGRIVHRLKAGTSTLFVVAALQSSVAQTAAASVDVGPLVYHDREWHVLTARSKTGQVRNSTESIGAVSNVGAD